MISDLAKPAKRRVPASSEPSAPKARQSKLAKEHNISAQEENEIKEAFNLFAQPMKGEKEGVVPTADVRKAMMYVCAPCDSLLKDALFFITWFILVFVRCALTHR
jgi:hydroxyacylglutathione hydrolase